jgi:hypothetical protein
MDRLQIWTFKKKSISETNTIHNSFQDFRQTGNNLILCTWAQIQLFFSHQMKYYLAITKRLEGISDPPHFHIWIMVYLIINEMT